MAVSARSNENPQSSSKHQKLSGEESGIDQISKLPDSLLCDILSFLPTKLVVATSILSKRWRFLWTWVPSLDFEENKDTADAPATSTSLEHILCRVLALRRQWRIKRFRLQWYAVCDSLHLDSWIYAAISRNVQELDLCIFNELPCSLFCSNSLVTLKLSSVTFGDVPSTHFPSLKTLHLSWIRIIEEGSVHKFFLGCPALEELDFYRGNHYGDNTFELPHCVFFIKTLVTLKLCCGMVLNIPSRACLTSLKNLFLEAIDFKDDNSVRNLFSGCPVLDDLYLGRFDCDNVIEYEIASPTLTTLDVNFHITGDSFDEAHSHSHKLRVNAPALEYLYIADVVSRSFYFENMDNLVRANVAVCPCYTKCGSIVLDVLRAVCNVTCLELDYELMNVFCKIDLFDKFPKFHNVTNLELMDFSCPWGVLRHILHKFPQLKHLTLEKGSVHEEPQGAWSTQPVDVSNCLTLHLTTFCFKRFEGLEDEMEYVRYILKNSMVLKKMTLITLSFQRLESERRLVVMQKLATFERGSKSCKLEYDG